MLFWHWQLLLATATGIATMALVYLIQQQNWQLPWSDLRKFFQGSDSPLLLAVVSGGMATLSTYLAVAIWRDSASPWIASGAILQGLGTLAVLILLVWQILNRYTRQENAYFNQRVTDLTQSDPLKRLIAVRQIGQLAKDSQLDQGQARIVAEYFRLLLVAEQEMVIRNAVLDGLQVLEHAQTPPSGITSHSVAGKRNSLMKRRRPSRIH
jgi:hypothetical protein